MLRKAGLYFRTLKHLRREQVQYRLYYMLRRRWRNVRPVQYPVWSGEAQPIQLLPSLSATRMWDGQGGFRFLNLSHDFGAPEHINWEFAEFGKLWTYNLCYFEYLTQSEITQEQGLGIIRAFIKAYPRLKTAPEPYPTSLRIIFWIRFLCRFGIQDSSIDRALYAQAQTLADHLEYHLLGNHLLENGFGLWFAAVYFQDEKLLKKAVSILLPELKEQILNDGAHFERSPMYHCIMLYRILDCFNLAQQNASVWAPCETWQHVFAEKAALMLGWLSQMTFSDGQYPYWADAAPDIAPMPLDLLAYAQRLGLAPTVIPLRESGYRRMDWGAMEWMADVGDIGPDYIPGHAHADTFSFVLHVQGKPFIVDTGISTYEKNTRRQTERSTSAHNTVQLGIHEQSEVWGGFRVGRRAYVRILTDDTSSHSQSFTLRAVHNGYAFIGGQHERTFSREGDALVVLDRVTDQRNESHYAYLHFAAGVEVHLDENRLISLPAEIQIEGATHIALASYDLPNGYNQFYPACTKAVITFKHELVTRFVAKV